MAEIIATKNGVIIKVDNKIGLYPSCCCDPAPSSAPLSIQRIDNIIRGNYNAIGDGSVKPDGIGDGSADGVGEG